MFRKIAHLLFNVFLLLIALNFGLFNWKEYVLLFLIGTAVGLSYTRFGRVFSERGRFGLNALDGMFVFVVFYLAAVAVAGGPPMTNATAWLKSTSFWITVVAALLGLAGILWRLAERNVVVPERVERTEDIGVVGEFLVAVLLAVIVIGAISLAAEWMLLPGGARASGSRYTFMLIVVNSGFLVLAGARVLADPGGSRPGGTLGLFVVSDYRPQFLVILGLLSAWGAYSSGRVLLAEWRAGMAYGAKDFVNAERELRSVERYNKVLKFSALERRTNERLGEIYLSVQKFDAAAECYRRMLGADPRDTLPQIKMVQLEALRGNYAAATRYLTGARLENEDFRALKRLDRSLAGIEDYVEGHYHVAALYLKRGLHKDAAEKLEAILARRPGHVLALSDLAFVREKEERAAEARGLRQRMVVRVDENDWKGPAGGVLKANGECNTTLELPAGAWEMTFFASGTPARGEWPKVKVRLDDASVSEVIVNSRDRAPFAVSFRVTEAAPHKLAVKFENDDQVRDADGRVIEDRDVHIHAAVLRWIDN